MEHLTSMKLDPSENVILEPLGLWNSIVTVPTMSRAVNLIWLSSVSAASPRLSDTVMSIGQIAENVIPMKVKAFPVYFSTTKISIKTLFSIYINMAPWIQICSCQGSKNMTSTGRIFSVYKVRDINLPPLVLTPDPLLFFNNFCISQMLINQ